MLARGRADIHFFLPEESSSGNLVMTTPATADRTTFASLAGFKPSYVTQLKKDNRLVLDAQGRILVVESLARIRETADPSKAGVAARHEAERAAKASSSAPENDQDADQDDDLPEAASAAQPRASSAYQDSRAKREHYLALAAQRDYEQSIGKLLNADDVVAVLAEAATAIRVRLEALADTLSVQLAAEPDESRCRALIAEAHEHALGELARAFRSAVPA